MDPEFLLSKELKRGHTAHVRIRSWGKERKKPRREWQRLANRDPLAITMHNGTAGLRPAAARIQARPI
jgi:hypothetical protein